jgi:ribonuclease D
VLHAARQDIALLRRTWGTEVRNVFDTQVAAGFTGRGAQMGYDPLLSDVLGVRLSKSASFTKWDRRPLTDEQLRYAREDVLHLQQLAVALQEELAGSSAWSGRARSAARWRASPTSATRTSSSAAAARRRARAADPRVARELVEWREDTARRQDKPASSVLPDAPLIEIARRPPQGHRAPAADPRPQRGRAAPARQGDHRGRRARPRPRADPPRRRPPDRGDPLDSPASRCARR